MQKCKFANLTDPDGWAGTTSREVAKDLGIGKSSVNDHRSGTCVCFRSKIQKIHPKAAKHLKVLTIDVENSPNVVQPSGMRISACAKPSSTPAIDADALEGHAQDLLAAAGRVLPGACLGQNALQPELSRLADTTVFLGSSLLLLVLFLNDVSSHIMISDREGTAPAPVEG